MFFPVVMKSRKKPISFLSQRKPTQGNKFDFAIAKRCVRLYYSGDFVLRMRDTLIIYKKIINHNKGKYVY